MEECFASSGSAKERSYLENQDGQIVNTWGMPWLNRKGKFFKVIFILETPCTESLEGFKVSGFINKDGLGLPGTLICLLLSHLLLM